MLQPIRGGKSNSWKSSRPDCVYELAFSVSSVTNFSLMPGYSGTPLPQKLGIKPDSNVGLIDAPPSYRKLLGPTVKSVRFSERVDNGASFVHLFATERSRLDKNLRQLRTKLAETGTVWVSWPKKTSGVQTDITEDVIRAVALPLGFVDVKVCAVDDIWSGLKLMIRREKRTKK